MSDSTLTITDTHLVNEETGEAADLSEPEALALMLGEAPLTYRRARVEVSGLRMQLEAIRDRLTKEDPQAHALEHDHVTAEMAATKLPLIKQQLNARLEDLCEQDEEWLYTAGRLVEAERTVTEIEAAFEAMTPDDRSELRFIDTGAVRVSWPKCRTRYVAPDPNTPEARAQLRPAFERLLQEWYGVAWPQGFLEALLDAMSDFGIEHGQWPAKEPVPGNPPDMKIIVREENQP